ncbi:hypothetical protein ILUMI_03028 [Ignelater luminosus]|uniref:DUF4371 domain-containing protein n=1 Tax=Ignelater luminosus TaxID=2038154 RepID=A0A8K0DBQ8_IGNLU|nr:hypothetical protein ILUMI_03028 [Ignelater luminosus]
MTEWTEQYCFTLPEQTRTVPVCLICNKTVAIVKSGSSKRHYETTQRDFHSKFPPARLYCSGACTNKKNQQKQRCVYAGPLISTRSHSQTLRQLEAATALSEEEKDIVTAIQGVLLSAKSNFRRTEILATDNKSSLLGLLKKAPYYAITVDESCDVVDDEQMSIFARFFDIQSKVLRDELVAILPFKVNTRGEDLFKAFDDFMTKSSLNYDKIVCISTDGFSAMIGKGNVHNSPDIKLSATLKKVMDGLIKLINSMKSCSALQRRQFKEFLSKCDSAYAYLLPIENQELIHFPTIHEYRKKNSEIDTAVFLSFMTDIGKEARFQDFAEIEKLSQVLKTPYDVSPAGQWTYIAAKLFRLSNPSLQMKMIDLQDVSLKMYKTVSTKEFWTERVLEKYENCKILAVTWLPCLAPYIYVRPLPSK